MSIERHGKTVNTGAPREVVVEKTTDVLSVKDSGKFEVECRAGDAGELCVGSEAVCVKVGQRVRRDGSEEIWHSVAVHAQQDDEANLVVRILVFHPEWDEALQIASIKSRPSDLDCETALGIDLDHLTP